MPVCFRPSQFSGCVIKYVINLLNEPNKHPRSSLHLKATINQAAIWNNLKIYITYTIKRVSLFGNEQHLQQVYIDNDQEAAQVIITFF